MFSSYFTAKGATNMKRIPLLTFLLLIKGVLLAEPVQDFSVRFSPRYIRGAELISATGRQKGGFKRVPRVENDILVINRDNHLVFPGLNHQTW